MLELAHLEPAALEAEPATTVRRTLGARLLSYAGAQLRLAQAQLARPGDERHAGIHEARKCLRRARAALALAGANLGPQAARIDRDLRQLCRGLSPLRDAQALIEVLSRLKSSRALAPESTREALEAARQRRDATLVKALARDRDFMARRLRLSRAQTRLARLDASRIDASVVRESLARSERRVRKADRRARRHRGDDEAWHTFRRRLRRLRQQRTLLAELEPQLAGSVKALDEQATALGRSQDDALLLARSSGRSPFSPALRQELRQVARRRLVAIRTPNSSD